MADIKSSPPPAVGSNKRLAGLDHCYTRVVTPIDMSAGTDSESSAGNLNVIKASLLAVDNENSLYALCADEIRKRTVTGKTSTVLGSKGNVGAGSGAAAGATSLCVDIHKHIWISSSIARTIIKITSAGNPAAMDLRFLKSVDSAGIAFGQAYWSLTSDKEGNVYAFDNLGNVRLIPYIPLKPVDYPVQNVIDAKNFPDGGGLAGFDARAMVRLPTSLMKDKANVEPSFVFASRWSIVRGSHVLKENKINITERLDVGSSAPTLQTAVVVDHDSHPSHFVYYVMSSEGIIRMAGDGTTKNGLPAGDLLKLVNRDGTPFRADGGFVSMVMDAFKTIYFTTGSGEVYSFQANSVFERLATPLGGKEIPHFKDEKAWRVRWDEHTKTQSFYLGDHDEAWSGVVARITWIKTTDKHKLLPKDVDGKSDPYAVLFCENSIVGTNRTSVISSTLQPAWNMASNPLSFPLTNMAIKRLKKRQLPLHVEMWDKDLTTSDFMGFGNVFLDPTITHYTIPLSEHTNTHCRPGGAIDMLIEFDTKDAKADVLAMPAAVPAPTAGGGIRASVALNPAAAAAVAADTTTAAQAVAAAAASGTAPAVALPRKTSTPSAFTFGMGQSAPPPPPPPPAQ